MGVKMGVKMGGKDGDFGKLETTSRSVRFAIHFQSIHQLGALVDLESSFFANFFLFFFAMILCVTAIKGGKGAGLLGEGAGPVETGKHVRRR